MKAEVGALVQHKTLGLCTVTARHSDGTVDLQPLWQAGDILTDDNDQPIGVVKEDGVESDDGYRCYAATFDGKRLPVGTAVYNRSLAERDNTFEHVEMVTALNQLGLV